MRRAIPFVALLLTLGGCCSTTQTYGDLAWAEAVRAARAVAEARADYDLEVDEDEDGVCATWRQEPGLLYDIFSAVLFFSSCDPWVRLELDRDQPLEASARVVNLDFVLFFIPIGSTNDAAEEHLLELFEAEVLRAQTAEQPLGDEGGE